MYKQGPESRRKGDTHPSSLVGCGNEQGSRKKWVSDLHVQTSWLQVADCVARSETHVRATTLPGFIHSWPFSFFLHI